MCTLAAQLLRWLQGTRALGVPLGALQGHELAGARSLRRALEELAVTREQLAALRACDVADGEEGQDACTERAIRSGQQETAALRTALKVGWRQGSSAWGRRWGV